MKAKLIFVYNANSDLFSTVTDFAHKILSPSTYQCQLCALTYGNFTIKQDWKKFIESLPLETVFLYKDEWMKQYNIEAALPAVFLWEVAQPVLLISKQEIENCQTVQDIEKLILEKINSYV